MRQPTEFRSECLIFLNFLTRYVTGWIILFLLCRIVFLLYDSPDVSLSGPTVIGVFLHGLRIDLSTAGYLSVIPLLLRFGHTLYPSRITKPFLTAYTLFMVLLVALITTSDLQIYRIWGTKLNAQAIAYLRYPKEAMASMSSSPILLLVFIWLIVTVSGGTIFTLLGRKTSLRDAPLSVSRFLMRFLLFLLSAGMLLIAIRGGTGLAPMNPGFAYFSTNQFANHAALNTGWNLMYDLKHHFRHKNNQFNYMNNDEMTRRVTELFPSQAPQSTQRILTTERPNIILVILESWTANAVGTLGAEKGITPFFDELCGSGILFTDLYASGYRTSFGVASVLSGFPSTPEGSILNRPNKMERLPTLAGSLKENGYVTSFYYGGDTHFDDMNAFFAHSKFDTVTNKSSFAAKDMNSKWGVHDHVLFERALADLSHLPQPFFTAMLTISSHEPFEVPMKTVFTGADPPSQFKNSIHYTDRSLKAFIEKARSQPWYKNTLFVFVADHGSGLLAKSQEGFAPERHRIPLLLYGEVIKHEYRGKKEELTAAQSDISATLLAQLNIRHDAFSWSNDLYRANRTGFAYYNFAGGFVVKTPAVTAVYDTVSNKPILNNEAQRAGTAYQETLKNGQAYLQNLYQKYSRF